MGACISAIGTASPQYRIEQAKIAEFMALAHHFDQKEKQRLLALYRATGIQHRYAVIPDYGKTVGSYRFYPNNENLDPFPATKARMELYKKEALPLAEAACEACLTQNVPVSYDEITHLITVSCTGMYAPGLDIDLINTLGLNPAIQRFCINFMGCYAAFNAIKLGHAICSANTDAKVLIVCVELCSLHFQKLPSEDNLLANALFGDGAAAVIMESEPESGKALSVQSFHCGLIPQGAKDMAWGIGDFGFEMTLSAYVPEVIKGGIRMLISQLKERLVVPVQRFDKYAIHPGGKKILQVIERELNIESGDNCYAYEILKEFGNMSSPTILFVLKLLFDDISANDQGQNVLGLAFGPGLTLESMVLKVVGK